MSIANAPDGKVRGLTAGLLVLRIGVGLSPLLIFGLPKLQTLNESVGAFLVACEFLSRYAAASLTVGFLVATICSLRAGEAAWLTAANFALMFTTLLLTGPGRFAVDSPFESRKALRIKEKAPSA